MIKRPDVIKVFASQAMQGDYLPVKFGTNIAVMKKDYTEIANDNFEFGLESLEKDLQLKDLNSVFFYHGSVLKYLFEQGVPEYSPYQQYELGSVVVSEGSLWIATKTIPAQLEEDKFDPCDPCGCKVSKDTSYDKPSKETGWCSFVTHCEYDAKMEELDETNKALQESIDSIKGVTHFKVIPNPLNQALELSLGLNDGSSLTIPMIKFGKFEEVNNNGIKSFKVTNPDGSIINLPAHKASVRLVNSNGTTIGFTHLETEKEGNFTQTVGLVQSDELNAAKGFYWNTTNNRWEVDIADLLKSGSGLQVDREGNVSIDTSWLQPKLDKAKNDAVTEVKQFMQNAGSKVFVKAPITGNGEKTNPLGLSLGEDLQIVDGKLTLKPVPPKSVTNVLNQGFKYGLHTFNGLSQNTVGLPLDINSNEIEQSSATTPTTSNHYDYNGYYIASGNQLDIWLIGVNDSAWKITNEGGIRADGSLVNPNDWGKWQKLDNASNLTNAQITSIQNQLNGLGNQTNDLQNQINQIKNKLDETCKVTVKNISANYTIQDTDNTLVVVGSNPVVITLDPNIIPMGRVFTVIQAGSGKVSFVSTNPSTLHAPLDGSLVMAGADAAVSIIFELNKHVRILGQTE